MLRLVSRTVIEHFFIMNTFLCTLSISLCPLASLLSCTLLLSFHTTFENISVYSTNKLRGHLTSKGEKKKKWKEKKIYRWKNVQYEGFNKRHIYYIYAYRSSCWKRWIVAVELFPSFNCSLLFFFTVIEQIENDDGVMWYLCKNKCLWGVIGNWFD